jgi:hypothetical protein
MSLHRFHQAVPPMIWMHRRRRRHRS